MMVMELVLRPATEGDRDTAHRLLTAQLVEHRLPADPDGVARRIVALRNSDRGDRPSGGARAGDSSRSPSAELPLTDIRQLIKAAGLAPERIAALAPLTTVYGGETVNPLTAPAQVIAALPGVDRGRLEAFLETRRRFPDDAQCDSCLPRW